MTTNKIEIHNSIVLNFGTKMNRRRPLSWGRPPKFREKFPCSKHKVWDDILEESISWTHKITINPDPKIQQYSNISKDFKKSLQLFLSDMYEKHYFKHIACVIETGKKGKVHAHALIRTSRAPTLLLEAIKVFHSGNIRKQMELTPMDIKQTAVRLDKIHDEINQVSMDCESRWIGWQNFQESFDIFPEDGWPYLRKEKQNHCYCWLSI